MIRSKRISAFLTAGVVQYLKFVSTLFSDVNLYLIGVSFSYFFSPKRGCGRQHYFWGVNLGKISIMTFQHIVIEMVWEEMILFLL